MTYIDRRLAFLSARNTKFIFLSLSILGLHVTQACVQEYIFQLKEVRKYSSVFTLNQFTFYSIFAYIHWKLRKKGICLVPVKKLALVGLLSTGTMALSNAAVAHLNYPTHLMFKSCKLIPVMIGSVLIVGKRYNPFNVLSCILMTVGVIFFTLGDCQVQPKFESAGVLLVCSALCFDAIVGNYQEKLFKEYPFLTNEQLVFYSYIFGVTYICVFETLKGLIFGSTVKEGIIFFNQNIYRTYILTGVYSITGYVGVIVILTMIKDFGALLAVTVTTMRKALTIVLSFLIFPKPFIIQYVWSGLLVLTGIWLDFGDKHFGFYQMASLEYKLWFRRSRYHKKYDLVACV
ncbi:hypothetical protein ACOME3_002800 [Neoechinorhynchus agilis]